MGGVRIPYKRLIGKSERKRPLGSPWYGWETNIKMDIKDGTREWGLDSLGSCRDQWQTVVNTVCDFLVP
jgi:hypothetical protein